MLGLLDEDCLGGGGATARPVLMVYGLVSLLGKLPPATFHWRTRNNQGHIAAMKTS